MEDRRAAFARLRDETRALRAEYNFVIVERSAGQITRAEEAALLAAIARRMRVVYREMRALLPGLTRPIPS